MLKIIQIIAMIKFATAQDESFKTKLEGPCPVIRGRIEPKNMTLDFTKLKGIWKTIYDYKRENKEQFQIKIDSFDKSNSS